MRARCPRACTWLTLLLAWPMTVAEPPDLDTLLTRLADNAARYRSRALRLTCTEEIRWVGNVDGGRKRFGYVYVFDDDQGFEEYRTRYREDPKPGARRVEPSEFGIPLHFSNAYLWCFTFRAERQRFHRYTIVGSDEVGGTAAVMVRFEPTPPLMRHVNDWYGTAWVDPETAQLLKVEAFSPQDWAALEGVRGGARLGPSIEIRRVTTLFGERLDGLRVPSEVQLRDEQYVLEEPEDWLAGQAWEYRVVTRHRVDQTYSDYRVFGVKTKESVRSVDPPR